MNKSKLKEDVVSGDGKKKKETIGIESTIKCVKSRYAKPFEEVDVLIPYETGMDRYSGLFEMFEKRGIFTRSGNWYSYTSKETGKELKKTKAAVMGNSDGILDLIMKEWTDDKSAEIGVDETPEGADVE